MFALQMKRFYRYLCSVTKIHVEEAEQLPTVQRGYKQEEGNIKYVIFISFNMYVRQHA